MNTELAERKSVLDEVLDLAVPADNTEAKAQLEDLLTLQKVLLPIEESQREDLEEKIRTLRSEVHQQMVGYPVLSLEPLTWRYASGLPKIVPMSLARNTFEIMAWSPRGADGSVAAPARSKIAS